MNEGYMSEQDLKKDTSMQSMKQEELWNKPQKAIQGEHLQSERNDTVEIVENKTSKKSSFGDGVNFGLLAFCLSGLIAMGSMGTLAGPVAIILLILFIYFAITKGWRFVLGYFLICLIGTLVLVGGFFWLMSSV